MADSFDLGTALQALNTLGSPKRERAKPFLAAQALAKRTLDPDVLDALGREMVLSEQQWRIVRSQDDLVKVEASAGSGKSTSLDAFARARPHQKILSLAFNTTVARQGQQKAPEHVTVKTSHGWALSQLKSWSSGKMLCGALPLDFLRSKLRLDQLAPERDSWILARLVEQTLRGFWASADACVLSSHVPRRALALLERSQSAAGDAFDAELLVRLATQAQQQLQDPRGDWPTPHDAYLKIFCLQGQPAPFDVVLLDEAQDSNPALLAWVLQQKGQKVLVGDAAQAIYGFRGAQNAMQRVPGSALHLSRSWRFGAQLADVANAALFFMNQSQPVTGAAKNKGAVLQGAPLLNTTQAYIARTNASLLAHAARAIENRQSFHFIGGPLALDRAAALDCARFAKGERPLDPWRQCFTTFEAYEAACRETGDAEGAGLCALAKERGPVLGRLFEALDRESKAQPQQAKLWLCSAHKAKGLEFDHVTLADDFGLSNLKTATMKPFAKDEQDNACVFYVAATRARKTLGLPAKTQAFVETFSLAFAQPQRAEALGFSCEDAQRLVDFRARWV